MTVVAALGMTLQGPLSSPAAPTSDAAIEAGCRPYFHDACSEAMGRWLPRFGFDASWLDSATRIEKRDGFIYNNERPSTQDFLGFQGPKDGTLFSLWQCRPAQGARRVRPRPPHRLFPGRLLLLERGSRSSRSSAAAEERRLTQPSRNFDGTRNSALANRGRGHQDLWKIDRAALGGTSGVCILSSSAAAVFEGRRMGAVMVSKTVMPSGTVPLVAACRCSMSLVATLSNLKRSLTALPWRVAGSLRVAMSTATRFPATMM